MRYWEMNLKIVRGQQSFRLIGSSMKEESERYRLG